MYMGKPVIPPEAEAEIMEQLSNDMRISSSEISEILEKYGVCGDIDALQKSYRKRLGQRLMASIRDENGRRELLFVGGEYVVVDCCNNSKKLRILQKKFQNRAASLDASRKKVTGRVQFLNRFAPQKKRRGNGN